MLDETDNIEPTLIKMLYGFKQSDTYIIQNSGFVMVPVEK